MVEVGPNVRNLTIGDQVSGLHIEESDQKSLSKTDVIKVSGFCFEEAKCRAYQEFVTTPETSLGTVMRKTVLEFLTELTLV